VVDQTFVAVKYLTEQDLLSNEQLDACDDYGALQALCENVRMPVRPFCQLWRMIQRLKVS